MTVIVLMYHHTPSGAPKGWYDAALTTFRDQVRALRNAIVSFIKFSDFDRPEYVLAGVAVKGQCDMRAASPLAESRAKSAEPRQHPAAANTFQIMPFGI